MPFPVPSNHAVGNSLPPLINLDVTSVSKALGVLGGYIVIVGQLSYWLKEKLYMSPALLTICLGIAVGPIGLNWISPWVWTQYNDEARNELTFQICRICISVQVMFAGISLPAAYLRKEWKSLAILLLPVMTVAWFTCAGLIYALIPNLTLVEALCVAACVTPTDPILANAIVKGRYAEKHVPRNVRNLISAESGANDGLGYPFLFLPIFLMRRGASPITSSLRSFVVTTILYQIVLSILIGAILGFIARKTLKEAHKRNLIDHESFLVYGLGLAFVTIAIVGSLGSDDVLAAFVAGNSLTWADFYRVESEDESFQDTIDGLLNTSIFIYIGTLLPWSDFTNATIPLSFWRLTVLAILILLVRRLPWIMALYKITPALHDRRQAVFAGWFGPIGVSAVYYAILAVQQLPTEREHLKQVIVPVVLFLAFASTCAHGISIPITKFGPRAFTRTRSSISIASTNTRKLLDRITAADISSPIRTPILRHRNQSNNTTPALSGSNSFAMRDQTTTASSLRNPVATALTSSPLEQVELEQAERSTGDLGVISDNEAVEMEDGTAGTGNGSAGVTVEDTVAPDMNATGSIAMLEEAQSKLKKKLDGGHKVQFNS